jgi:hypothetical protein
MSLLKVNLHEFLTNMFVSRFAPNFFYRVLYYLLKSVAIINVNA